MTGFPPLRRSAWRALAGFSAALLAATATASVGLTRLQAGETPVTVYYPSSSPETDLPRGPFVLHMAANGVPGAGNGRLVVISHGSGAAPSVHADLARSLVEAGFTVALPWHEGDNATDTRLRGPASWDLRPAEVSGAIDAIAAEGRLAPLQLDLRKVGLYGYSAGGHTALSLAGGRWSPDAFWRHCDAHLAEDFQTCVGLATRLKGNGLDGLKLWIARRLIHAYFAGDDRPRFNRDPRIAAIVAALPVAADFDPASLAQPAVPLALITAGQDRWLIPRFHAEAVLRVCSGCERLLDLPQAGHGAMLSPAPRGLSGLEGNVLNDPPGYDRAAGTALINAAVVGFFRRQLLPTEDATSRSAPARSPDAR